MAIHHQLPIYKVAYNLADLAIAQSHSDRARLANVLRSRGLTIDKHFTKTYRTKETIHE